MTHSKLAAAALLILGATAQAAGLSAGGYTENFNAMGTNGTAAPAGWTVLTSSGGSNSTWTTTIPGNGSNSVASLVSTSGALTAVTTPSGTNNNGFNAAASAANTADRVLATSPTTVAGGALQLQLSNETGYAFDTLTISYDTYRFTTASTVNELPGYWLFYSLDGSSWTNVAALNPTLSTVPNTVGVSSFSSVVNLGASVAAGQSLWLRWVDDNARQTSPDQIIGLDNVSILAAVPEPESYALMLLGLAGLGFVARRRAGR